MDLPFETDGAADWEEPGGTLASSILIVDDEPVVLDVLTRLLSREQNLAVSTADSAESAVDFLTGRRFDLLITDKNLPRMGGIELIGEARNRWPAIEAMVITGYANAESVIAALAAGATDYLLKPFEDLAVVRAKIRATLDRRTARVKDREASNAIARQAEQLLTQGKRVPDPVWDSLERQLAMYDKAALDAGLGSVLVVGEVATVAALCAEGLEARWADATHPQLDSAEVVVLDTSHPGWSALAERLRPASPDLLLLARPNADLADLLEAISLRMELVGFGASPQAKASLLPAKIRALLMRRAVQRAQAALSKALNEFRLALKKA